MTKNMCDQPVYCWRRNLTVNPPCKLDLVIAHARCRLRD